MMQTLDKPNEQVDQDKTIVRRCGSCFYFNTDDTGTHSCVWALAVEKPLPMYMSRWFWVGPEQVAEDCNAFALRT